MISKSAKLQVSLLRSSAGGHLSMQLTNRKAVKALCVSLSRRLYEPRRPINCRNSDTKLMQEECNHETEIFNYQ